MSVLRWSPPPEKTLHVDHIKPISLYWELRLDKSNVQVLCGECNVGKSNIYRDDYTGDKPAYFKRLTIKSPHYSKWKGEKYYRNGSTEIHHLVLHGKVVCDSNIGKKRRYTNEMSGRLCLLCGKLLASNNSNLTS